MSFGASGNNVFANRNSSVKSTKQFKIICVGESQVGKTSLIQRYIDNQFQEHVPTTLSWDFREKRCQLGEGDPSSPLFRPTELVRMFLWDTAG